MPRKTRTCGSRLNWRNASFNEAAARCRGKHAAKHAKARELLAASMRPRPDAAENSSGAA